jgi:hypothetical protein
VYFGPSFALPIQLLRVKSERVVTVFGNFFANVEPSLSRSRWVR